MFSEEYLAKRMEESVEKVDPSRLNWEIIRREREKRPTVLFALEESYHKYPLKKKKPKK